MQCRWYFQSHIQDFLLSLQSHDFWPFHESSKVSFWLYIISNWEVLWCGCEEWVFLCFALCWLFCCEWGWGGLFGGFLCWCLDVVSGGEGRVRGRFIPLLMVSGGLVSGWRRGERERWRDEQSSRENRVVSRRRENERRERKNKWERKKRRLENGKEYCTLLRRMVCA